MVLKTSRDSNSTALSLRGISFGGIMWVIYPVLSWLNELLLNPSPTSGQAIYDAAIGLLDQAIANFGNADAPAPSVDFYYGGNKSKWIKAANSIKKKIYLNLGDSGSYNGV